MQQGHHSGGTPVPLSEAAQINLTEIASRWKFRPTAGGGRTAADSATHYAAANAMMSAPPPDIRSDFLKLRAELLRREPLMVHVPSVEKELASTLDLLRAAELECKELRLQSQDLQSALIDANRQRDKHTELIAKLQKDLLDVRGQLDEERAHRLRHPSSASGGLLSPQGSLSGAVNGSPTVMRSAALVSSSGVKPGRANSPSASRPISSVARSPARTR